MPALEVADVFRRHGEAYRQAHAGHLGRAERRVMGAIEACRTAALGGHVERCAECGLVRIAYNSCRNRHCPKCQGQARADWLAERQAELLPVPYFHVVFTLPAPAAEIAFQNKAAVYAILFRAAAETLSTIAADPTPSRRRDRFRRRAAYLGPEPAAPSARALPRPRRRLVAGRQALGFLSARLLPAGAGAVAPVPSAVPGEAAGRLRCRQTGVLRRAGRSRRRTGLRPPPQRIAPRRVGGLCQAALCRTRGGLGLSRSLHAPRRHRQQPADRHDGRCRSAFAGAITAITTRAR